MMDDTRPQIFTSAAFDQAGLTRQTEDLQDHRRENEGTLIIIDDRPLLVKSFGRLYQGQANKGKYKVEGKFDIPVGYRVLTKWDEDEILFWIEEGEYGPRFKIIYMPRSAVQEDFTVLEWNQNMAEIWDELLTLLERKDQRDIRMFNQGPWRVFGVTRDEVQIAVRQGHDQRTYTTDILFAADGISPSEKEWRTYLGYDRETDKDFLWLFKAFEQEPLPSTQFQYINDGMVYWVDGHTQESSWKHPLYDKYKNMLYLARIEKPLPLPKTVMAFRIGYLLNQVYAMYEEDDEEEPEPLVETVENVIEMARIMAVNLEEKPFLVHVLKRALRHYGKAVKEKRTIQNVDDFRQLIQRNNDIVDQYQSTRDAEAQMVQLKMRCVQCGDAKARLFCDQCKDYFCQGCFERLHARGRRANHRRSWVEMGLCEECQESPAMYHCTQCTDLYCRDCFASWHVRGGRRNHIPIILRAFNAQASTLPEATPLMGTGCQKVLEQAYSPWLVFSDVNNINSYYNIKTGETRRDMPMETINEPIADKAGGGLAGGWAGSWGANMFPDSLSDGGKERTRRTPLGRV